MYTREYTVTRSRSQQRFKNAFGLIAIVHDNVPVPCLGKIMANVESYRH